MPFAPIAADAVHAFVARWQQSGGSELANAQGFLADLCRLLGVPEPEAQLAERAANVYTFEMPVTDPYADKNKPPQRIDLYRKDCFVLEAKQGVGASAESSDVFGLTAPPVGPVKRGIGVRGSGKWHDAMAKARHQAQRYVGLLPDGHRPPPFVVVADVGHCLELWANFARDGKAYHQFPSQPEFRIYLQPQPGRQVPTLADPAVQERLYKLWTDPESLDPARTAAKVSREAADVLARLARMLEAPVEQGGGGYAAEQVAQFLMRCMFTMFAEDTGLLPAGAFADLLQRMRATPHAFASMLTQLWQEMNQGTQMSMVLQGHPPIRKFNGQLFAGQEALPLQQAHIDVLIVAANRDWSLVEPAIFGTLLERALSPTERHKLGAHYTPRAYVERLVEPTVLEPLRADWRQAQAEAMAYELARPGTGLPVLERFHQALCQLRILDPACGSGNFLYVALDLLKRLEGEVLQAIDDLRRELRLPPRSHKEGGGEAVHPRQFLGIEVNPRAAVIAEAVLWIGYLQWQQKHLRSNDPELVRKLLERPVLETLRNIDNRDAVLDWDGAPHAKPVTGEDGRPKTVWDGVSTKKHPVTGLDVPDESKQRLLYAYPNPRKASWPKVDFVVGNPPFIGKAKRRAALGDGYLDALQLAYPEVPDGVDLVMYWWARAADLLGARVSRGFGFITTNSITQALNRRVLSEFLKTSKEFRLQHAIGDHPWVEAESGAAVRIAMTCVARASDGPAMLGQVQDSDTLNEEAVQVFWRPVPLLHADLRGGANVQAATGLRANRYTSAVGLLLFGHGFVLSGSERGSIEAHVRKPFVNCKDLVLARKPPEVIDLFPLSLDEALESAPAAVQHLMNHVKPDRDQIRDPSSKKNWWRFGRDKPDIRLALQGLDRYIATGEVSKHRWFTFVDHRALPDHTLVVTLSDDAKDLGILSSSVHQTWAAAAGSRMGVGNDLRYNKSRCFDPFPFPAANDEQMARIRDLGERLDAHRKRQQALHPDLTLTGMYNVLQALREGRPLTAKEKTIHEQGLCTLLLQLHRELDLAVLDAYGWPHDLDDEAILQRLVDLNAERAEEERNGLVRWLRPAFQNPQGGSKAVAQHLVLPDAEQEPDGAPAQAKPAFPRKPADALAAVRAELQRSKQPRTLEQIVAAFDGANPALVEAMLAAMESYGEARLVDGELWVGG